MIVWKCGECGETFNEPELVRTSYEDEFGVGDLFGNSTPMTIALCPYCGSRDIDEVLDDEDDDEI